MVRTSCATCLVIKTSCATHSHKHTFAPQAEDRVLHFITTHNRPWNVLGVSDHLAQFGVKKAQVQRALDTLSEGGKVTCKEFGKAKLYLPLQPDEAGLPKEASSSFESRAPA